MNSRPPLIRSQHHPENTAQSDSDGADRTADTALVQRFVGGDESAFTEIFNRHRERVFGLAMRLLRNVADAEEITQDTFVRAYRALPRFRGDSSLATWLHHIAQNLARNRYWYFLRRKRPQWVSLEQPLGPESSATFADLIASPERDPAGEHITGEFVEAVQECLRLLPAQQREILTLRHARELPYEEIARLLAINVGTVKSRIARARESLRASLAESFPELKSDAVQADLLGVNSLRCLPQPLAVRCA